MKVAENKCLRTMGRIFGPAVEKAMPVMLKVAFGSIGVLFVTALVLIYSDKRFGEGWGHAEAMAFMFQRAAVILMWLVLVALVVAVIWFVVYMAINSRTENRKSQLESQPTVQPTAEPKKLKLLAPIDEEKLKPYFKASFKGMGQNINHFPDLIRELEHIRKGSATDVGRAAAKARAEIERQSDVEYIPKKEAIDLLGVCDATLWHWARSGYLVPVKLGRRVFYRRTDIQRLLNR